MRYYRATDKDYADIKSFCMARNINPPDSKSIIFYAINEDQIVGVCAIRTIVQVEPIVCDSPLVANVLLEKATAVASCQTSKVIGFVEESNDKTIELHQRVGAVFTHRNMAVCEFDV